MQKEKIQAYNSNLETMATKFKTTSQKIKEKEQMFIDLAQKGRDSLA